MIEVLVILALVGGLVGAPALMAWAPWEITFGTGLMLVVVGMGLGVPAGAYYHYRLWRALKPTGLWWLHPTALHGDLSKADRPPVMRWMKIGGAMFGVAILGCLIAAVGAVRAR
jgi:hypothetical protein